MKDVAISIKAVLENTAGSKHVYPATFAGTGHNFVGLDKATGKAQAVQIDSVGSFANRIEAELAETGILPEIQVEVAGRSLSIHDIPHRVYDAILRDSVLAGQAWRASPVGREVLASDITNATALFHYAPLTLLLGGWDSHGGTATGTKIARSVSCEIWGYGVQSAQHCTQRIDPLDITADSERCIVNEGILQIAKDPKEGKKPSELGHGDVPGSVTKGVFVDRIELTGAISLARLSRYRFPDADGNDSEERNNAAQEVLVQLALLGVARVMDRLDLRSGCELYTISREIQRISADGNRTSVEIPSGTAQLEESLTAAAGQGLTFANSPLVLQASPTLEGLANKGGV